MAHEMKPAPSEPTEEQRTADLSAVLPMTAEIRDGRLFIGGVDMVELARTRGTALYVMDEATIRHQLSEYVRWTRFHWKEVDVVYAGKAFLSLAMVKLVQEEDCCLLCASGGELAYALAAGFPMERVQVHGNNKTRAELAECVEAGVGRVVVDNFDEMERLSVIAAEKGETQRVLVRVTPGIAADTHEFIMTGAEDSKFGFGLNQGLAMEAVKRAIALPGLDFDGLHMHIGSQIYALRSFSAAIERMVGFMSEIRGVTGTDVRMLDVGGGLGVAYGVPDEPSTVKDFGKIVVDGIKEECERHGLPAPRMAVEPGRSVVANAGVTLYTVGTIKEIPGIRTYAAVDGGMSDNVRTSLYGAHYEALVANKADRERTMVATIAGKHCESGDIVVRDAPLQEVEVGDVICVCATGAYCQSLSSNYNKQVRPAVVFVRDGEARVVVKRETYGDLLRNEVA